MMDIAVPEKIVGFIKVSTCPRNKIGLHFFKMIPKRFYCAILVKDRAVRRVINFFQ